MADSKVKELAKALQEIEDSSGVMEAASRKIATEAEKTKKRLLSASDDESGASEIASKPFQVITETMAFLRSSRGYSDVEQAYKDLKQAKEALDKAAKAKQRQ